MMKIFQCVVAAVMIALVAGCVSAASHASSATKPASTQPHVLHLAGAVALEKLRTEDTDFDLRYRIPEGGGTLYVGQLETTDAHDEVTATAPVIVAKIKGEWRALSLADDRLPDAAFVFIASGPAKSEIWAVMDGDLSDSAEVVLLAHSTDAGQTWKITPMRKPGGVGSYDSFAMDKSGHGRLTIYLDRKQSAKRPGFYHFRTSDDGETWSKSDYEADHLKSADEIPDDEDPEPLKDLDPVKTTANQGRPQRGHYSYTSIGPMAQKS
jgi:hypothetical protein